MANQELKVGDFITNGNKIIKILGELKEGQYPCGIIQSHNLISIQTIDIPSLYFKRGHIYGNFVSINESFISDMVLAQFRKYAN